MYVRATSSVQLIFISFVLLHTALIYYGTVVYAFVYKSLRSHPVGQFHSSSNSYVCLSNFESKSIAIWLAPAAIKVSNKLPRRSRLQNYETIIQSCLLDCQCTSTKCGDSCKCDSTCKCECKKETAKPGCCKWNLNVFSKDTIIKIPINISKNKKRLLKWLFFILIFV